MKTVYVKWEKPRYVYSLDKKEYVTTPVGWREVDRKIKGPYGSLATKEDFVDNKTTGLLNYAAQVGWSSGHTPTSTQCEVIKK